MEFIVNIKEQNKIAAFLNLIKEIDYIEIIDVKEKSGDMSIEHRNLLDKRLQRILSGETKFKNWDLVMKKYENKAI